ncbi:MAG: cupredoxin domain-containing protein [Actinobacteria bacterium]|nr:cupredoxin domain-containing protein [Actinomycetota bacterium]
MFNAASRTYFILAGGAVVVGFGYVFTTGDRVGFTALVFAGVTAVALGIGVFGFTPPEPLPAGDEAAEPRAVDTTDVPVASAWPLVGALAVAVLAAGLATDTSLIAIGLAFGVVATFAWFGQVWREHPSWTEEMNERLHDRFVVPIGLPGTIVVLAGIGVVSLSRLMLAISREAAPVVGSLIAFAILGGFYLVSSRNLGRRALSTLAAVSAGLVLASGVAGAVMGEREFHHPEAEDAFVLAAENVEFDKDELDFPAATKIKLKFENHDDVQHNFALLRDEGSEPIFRGPVIDKGETIYEFTTPEAGTYYFQCDVHPAQMNGRVDVSVSASEAPKPGENVTTTSAGNH